MTPDPGNMEQLSAEIALGNDLHYSQLVPQVGFHFPIQTNYGEDFAKSWPFLSVFVQSAVFTLGFTPSDRSLVGKMEKLGTPCRAAQAPTVVTDLSDHLPRLAEAVNTGLY